MNPKPKFITLSPSSFGSLPIFISDDPSSFLYDIINRVTHPTGITSVVSLTSLTNNIVATTHCWNPIPRSPKVLHEAITKEFHFEGLQCISKKYNRSMRGKQSGRTDATPKCENRLTHCFSRKNKYFQSK